MMRILPKIKWQKEWEVQMLQLKDTEMTKALTVRMKEVKTKQNNQRPSTTSCHLKVAKGDSENKTLPGNKIYDKTFENKWNTKFLKSKINNKNSTN